MSDSRVSVGPFEAISPEKMEILEALQGADEKPWTARFSKEDDAILMKYWGVKKQSDISRIIGYSINTCRKRYRELTEGKNEAITGQ